MPCLTCIRLYIRGGEAASAIGEGVITQRSYAGAAVQIVGF